MKKSKCRVLLCLCAALVCMLSLSVSAFASANDTESGTVFSISTQETTMDPNKVDMDLALQDKDYLIGIVVTNGSLLNVRVGGGTDYALIDQLYPGEQVAVLSQEGDWYQVLIPGKTGYVYKDYLRISDTVFPTDDMASFTDLLLSMLNACASSEKLTPEGNLTLVDDIQQTESVDSNGEVHSKQFVTLQSKNGNYFYLVIDRSGETENVYFLNLVDEADLMALMEDGEVTPKSCTCKDKCTAGHVDITCPVCATDMTECVGKEPIQEQTDTDTEGNKDEQQPEEKKDTNPALIIVLVLALGGGAAYYFLKVKKNQPKTKGSTDLNEYDFGEDNTEMEFEPYEEISAESTGEAPKSNEGTDEE